MFASKKPYSAVSVHIERLTSEIYEENDVGGIVDLVEVIRLQDSGPTEAARAIRKKLKYGNVHRQLRALTILDGLIQNAGPRFQRTFLDEPLLERLRIAATDSLSDVDVKKKCKVLFGQWAVAYKDTPGLERLTALYRQLPQRKRPPPQQQSKVLRETEQEAEADQAGAQTPPSATASSGGARRTASRSISSPTQPFASPSSPSSSSSKPITLSSGPNFKFSSSSSKDKKGKLKPFNLEKEKPQLLQTIASSSVASTNLMNALRLVNRENKRVSEDPEVMRRFETCKLLRRQILRYIQNVESEQWLGGLIHANEELVNALVNFEVLDKSTEADSDSDSDEWDKEGGPAAASASSSARPSPPARPHDSSISSAAADALAGLNLSHSTEPAPPAKPPRPTSISMPPPVPTAMTQAHANGKGRMIPQPDSEPESDDQAEEFDDADEDDPFADRNAVHTPGVERAAMTWRH